MAQKLFSALSNPGFCSVEARSRDQRRDSLNRQISGIPLILPGGGVEQGKDRGKEVLRSAEITRTGYKSREMARTAMPWLCWRQVATSELAHGASYDL